MKGNTVQLGCSLSSFCIIYTLCQFKAKCPAAGPESSREMVLVLSFHLISLLEKTYLGLSTLWNLWSGKAWQKKAGHQGRSPKWNKVLKLGKRFMRAIKHTETPRIGFSYFRKHLPTALKLGKGFVGCQNLSLTGTACLCL